MVEVTLLGETRLVRVINGRMIKELIGGDKIIRKSTARVENGLGSTLGSGSIGQMRVRLR